MRKICPDCGAQYDGQRRCCGSCHIARYGVRWRLLERANGAVASAINAGKLQNPKTMICVDCGNAATEYDHRDYRKPLDVAPVCRPCNHRRGPANLPPEFRAQQRDQSAA